MITYLDEENKKVISFQQLKKELSKLNNGSFIYFDMVENFIKEKQFKVEERELFDIIMYILKFNENIYKEKTINNKDLSFRTLKFDDDLLKLKKIAFVGPLVREKQINDFYEQIQLHKYYQLDDNFDKILLSLLISSENLEIDTSECINYIDNIIEAYHHFSIDFYLEYYSILDEIKEMDIDKNFWREIRYGEKYNCKDHQLYIKFMEKHNKIKEVVSNTAAKDLYAFYMDFNDKTIWLNIFTLVQVQELYQNKSKKIFFNEKKFEKSINGLYGSNIDDIIEDMIDLYNNDIKSRPNLKKAIRWLNNLNKYIRIKDIEKFNECFEFNSREMIIILFICLLQNDAYNKLALEEYKLQQENKSNDINVENQDNIINITKESLIDNIDFSSRVKSIMLDKNFSFEKVDYIVSNIKVNMLTTDFIERNIIKILDKEMYKRLKHNIKLFNVTTKNIISYNDNIMFEDNDVLKRRIKTYNKDYKLPINGIDNYEFLLNDDIFTIIDEFIKLGFYKVIKIYPKYLSINSINILKRLQIASTDPSITVTNLDLSFTDEIVTGNGFPLTDSELDEYVTNTSLNDIANKLKQRDKILVNKK